MSILYKLSPIKDTINEVPKEGLIAKAISRGILDVDELAKEIAKGTSFHESEVIALISVLAEEVESKLHDGYTVRLGELGTFFVSAQSRMVQEETEIRSQSVKVKRITYKPSRALSNRMKTASFERTG